ncbi:MAG: hypothetical protein IH971_02910 [Candidatus Marinimicrobia bacterium]|nr:hypothetical protein [Candidatus Neomarinimicrobiota bacterium]
MSLVGRWHPSFKTIIFAGMAGIALVQAGCELINSRPSIDITVEDLTPLTGSTQMFTAVVEDLDEDNVLVTWSATSGQFSKTRGQEVAWTAPLEIQQVVIMAFADDRKAGGTDTAQVTLSVVNQAPHIVTFTANEDFVTLGNSITLTSTAEELDGEEFVFEFSTSPTGVGTMIHAAPEINTATWIAPSDPSLAREYDLVVKVSDIQGFFSSDTLQILVFSEFGTIWIVDKFEQQVTKYTSRGEKILSARQQFQNPVAVTNNTNFDFFGCYVADQDAGQVIKLDAKGETIATFANLPAASDLAIHYGTGSLWVVSVGDAEPRLTVINTFTENVIASVRGLRHPSAITINQNRNEVWIADIGEMDRIVQINITDFIAAPPDTLDPAVTTVFEGNYNNPTDIALLQEQTATVYIADMNDDEVERLLYNSVGDSYIRGAPVDLGLNSKPAKVGVGPNGLVWVLGLDRSLQFFPEDNTTQHTPIFSYMFAAPHTLAIDNATGHVWIGDNGTHQVVEISEIDSVGVTIGGFSFVEDMVINK